MPPNTRDSTVALCKGTKLLLNEFRGRAYYAVESKLCDTVTQLIDLLNGKFGSPKVLAQYRGAQHHVPKIQRTHARLY